MENKIEDWSIRIGAIENPVSGSASTSMITSLLKVAIEASSTSLGAEGLIDIPAPHRGKHPVIYGEQDSMEGNALITNWCDSSYVRIPRKITDIEINSKSASGKRVTLTYKIKFST